MIVSNVTGARRAAIAILSICLTDLIEVPLPADFKQADVARLHAFLLTQIDDPLPAPAQPETKVNNEANPS